jgi:hypothetical protein
MDDEPLALLSGRHLTPAERAWLGHRQRAAIRELLGAVGELLTGDLGGRAEWVRLWTGFGAGQARFEWEGGPPMATVVDLLRPRVEDGELRGVAGLRLRQAEGYYAIFDWFAHPTISLYLTCLSP